MCGGLACSWRGGGRVGVERELVEGSQRGRVGVSLTVNSDVTATFTLSDAPTPTRMQGNPVLKYAMCCVKYCMWYLEGVMKFINRNAYAVVAVKVTRCWTVFCTG